MRCIGSHMSGLIWGQVAADLMPPKMRDLKGSRGWEIAAQSAELRTDEISSPKSALELVTQEAGHMSLQYLYSTN